MSQYYLQQPHGKNISISFKSIIISMASSISYAVGICFILFATGCLQKPSFLAPSGEASTEESSIRVRAPLPGDLAYKKNRFMFNPPHNTIGWILISSTENKVSMFSPRTRVWITGGYLPLRAEISFSDKETFLKEFKEKETAFLTGKEVIPLTDPALHQGFVNLEGEMDFQYRIINEQNYYTSEYTSDLILADDKLMRQRIFLYLSPDKNLQGIYALAMIVPEETAKAGQSPLSSFMEVVNNFIIKEP